jgi:signal transduction histidine kinase
LRPHLYLLQMRVAPVPAKERERLKALSEYRILDTEHETDYEFITELAANICGTCASGIYFIDAQRQWFKSCNGFMMNDTIWCNKLAVQAIDTPDKIVVFKDLSEDDWFNENPFRHDGAPLVFYAGAALQSPSGAVVGVLCVFDNKPGSISLEQKQKLLLLASQVVSMLELRKTRYKLQQRQSDIEMAYADLENIAHLASHDLRTPLNNIISLAHLIKEELGETIGEAGQEYVNFINEAAYYMSDLVSSIHSYSKASKLSVDRYDRINTAALMDELMPLLKIPGNCTFIRDINVAEITAPALALKQILFHLLLNAIQYNDKPQGKITFGISENTTSWIFYVADNGEGIAPDEIERSYHLFKRLRNRDKNGENMGMGLSIVKRLIEKMHGNLTTVSEMGKGTTFTFTIPK